MNYFVSLHSNCKNMQENKTISAYKQDLRDKILRTAMSAFAENGIKAVKMDDIAARLSISKRTLYELYCNKEKLLSEGIKAYQRQKREEMELMNLRSENVMELMLGVYKMKVDEFRVTSPLFYSDLSKYPQVLQMLKMQNQTNHGHFVKFMERGVKEGYFRKDVNYELAGRLFEALGRYVMELHLYEQFNIEEIFNNLVFVSLRGLCTEKGVKALEKFH